MSEIRATTISDAAGTGPIALTGQSAAKAWVNFNGTGTVSVRGSFNVSTLTDDATGKYTASYTNSMSDGNYVITTATVDGATTQRGGNTLNLRDGQSPATGSIGLEARSGASATQNGVVNDIDYVFVTVNGDLA